MRSQEGGSSHTLVEFLDLFRGFLKETGTASSCRALPSQARARAEAGVPGRRKRTPFRPCRLQQGRLPRWPRRHRPLDLRWWWPRPKRSWPRLQRGVRVVLPQPCRQQRRAWHRRLSRTGSSWIWSPRGESSFLCFRLSAWFSPSPTRPSFPRFVRIGGHRGIYIGCKRSRVVTHHARSGKRAPHATRHAPSRVPTAIFPTAPHPFPIASSR